MENKEKEESAKHGEGLIEADRRTLAQVEEGAQRFKLILYWDVQISAK